MNPDALHLERLASDHKLAAFRSEVDELDTWLRSHALAAQRMDSARTFVVVRSDRVVAYVSLTMGSVRRADAPAPLVRGLPGYPVGMVLIARLAVDRTEQGAGVGTRLLADALRLAVAAGETVAARLVAVDAIDERAAQFYRRHGFTSILGDSLRLYRRMKDVRASLDAGGSREGAGDIVSP